MEVSLKHDGSRVIPAPEADPVSPLYRSEQKISQPTQLRHATTRKKLHMMIKRTNDIRDDRRAVSSYRVALLDRQQLGTGPVR